MNKDLKATADAYMKLTQQLREARDSAGLGNTPGVARLLNAMADTVTTLGVEVEMLARKFDDTTVTDAAVAVSPGGKVVTVADCLETLAEGPRHAALEHGKVAVSAAYLKELAGTLRRASSVKL